MEKILESGKYKPQVLAQLAEQAERYDDMVVCMKKLVEEEDTISKDQRNLLSVAYKNVVGAKRTSWRQFSANAMDAGDAELLETYSEKIKKEIIVLCTEVVKLVDDILKKNDEPTAESDDDLKEAQVFYLKMQGDYHRYLAELGSSKDKEDDEETKKFAANANAAYKSAMDAAKKLDLPLTNPTRLGLALNYSVCQYEISNDPKNACETAKEAFDQAIKQLDKLNDNSYKDSTLIMQLLRDNLALWNSEMQKDKDAPPEA